ncbi:MAG: hypothetical protein PHU61_02500 [Candidatus Absconditabacteria bacterium]|nr:hypothetical protein [Candidatus Absconditabacteria bacterium]MDD3868156.1 hypothetical protein [Candidatus Absconditabacteria bacterium]MDD4714542.1 hypothetical protein [Candidatus Absconditabacteria bacterium]
MEVDKRLMGFESLTQLPILLLYKDTVYEKSGSLLPLSKHTLSLSDGRAKKLNLAPWKYKAYFEGATLNILGLIAGEIYLLQYEVVHIPAKESMVIAKIRESGGIAFLQIVN